MISLVMDKGIGSDRVRYDSLDTYGLLDGIYIFSHRGKSKYVFI